MKTEELEKILNNHEKWFKSNFTTGKKANLSSADLMGANLCNCNFNNATISFRTEVRVVRFFTKEENDKVSL